MLVRLLQSENAEAPISVTLSGIVTDFRLTQEENAPISIRSAPWGTTNSDSPPQFRNISTPIRSIRAGSVTVFNS